MAARRRMAGPRRKRVWMRNFGTDTLVGTTPDHVDLASIWASLAAPNLIGATVVRTLVTFAAARTAGSSVLLHVVVGLHVGPDTLDAVDHDPVSGAVHLDWMFWRKSYLNEGAGGQAMAALGTNAWSFDIKSQWKLEELNDTLWLVWSGTLTDEFAVSWGVSALVLLP